MFNNPSDFILSAIIFLTGGTLCIIVANRLKLSLSLVIPLVLWHTALSIYYANYVLIKSGDALGYYNRAKFEIVNLAVGTEFVDWLTSFPVGWGLSFGAVSMLYNMLGTLGLVFFCGTMQETGVFSVGPRLVKRIAVTCLFLPSLSFWTSGIGKDSLAFLSAGLFLWSTMNIGRRPSAAIAAVLIMFAVRPHIAGLMVLSIAGGMMFAAEVKRKVRISAAVVATAAAVFMVPFVLVATGASEAQSFDEYVDYRQDQNNNGGSSIDISAMNPFVRILSFTYRPMPYEANGIDQFAASLDNLFLILLTLVGLGAITQIGFTRVFRRYSIMSIYGFSVLVILSQTIANLGLATRQKWMLIPAFMIVFVTALSEVREVRALKRSSRGYLAGAAQQLR